jgi:hypothetical protein
MRRHILTAEDAAHILFGEQIEEDGFDPGSAQFRSGADVCDALAMHFGFTHEDYAKINAHLVSR